MSFLQRTRWRCRKYPEKLVVVGGGYIGLELGTAFAKLGSKVTVVEALPKILPQYDAELTRPVSRIFPNSASWS